MYLQSESEFFHDIAVQVIDLVRSYEGRAEVAEEKELIGDIATEVDLAVEKLIVGEIQRRFPDDAILAEEGYSDTAIPEGRIWIIDPICGTQNLQRGISWFCTNIALADGGQLVAGCVTDHSQGEYYWSVGEGKLYLGNQLLKPRNDNDSRVMIDVDFGALPRVNDDQRRRHFEAVLRLSKIPGYLAMSPNSSLGFAYVATGRLDGFINVISYPWDVCASIFLIQQGGGVITDIEGRPWTISSQGVVAARSAEIHQKLLEVYK